MVSIQEIFIYPIKGCGGLSVNFWPIESRGLRYDRQWMLIDEQGRFISQRECPVMALFRVHWHNGHFTVHFDGSSTRIRLPFPTIDASPIKAKVWDDVTDALHLPGECEDYFAHYLGRVVRLVFMPDDSWRRVDERFSPKPHYTRFSDGYPVLILGTASMDLLSQKLGEELPVDRFRPNLLLNTSIPHIEDSWNRLDHPMCQFELVKPCARCIVTTIDQKTGIQHKEPLSTLATYRKVGHKINFAMNALVENAHELSMLSIGDGLQEKRVNGAD